MKVFASLMFLFSPLVFGGGLQMAPLNEKSPECQPGVAVGTPETISSASFDHYIAEASYFYKIPPALILAQLTIESRLNIFAENRPQKYAYNALYQKKKSNPDSITAEDRVKLQYAYSKGLAMFGRNNRHYDMDIYLDWDVPKPTLSTGFLDSYNVGVPVSMKINVQGEWKTVKKLKFPIWSPRGNILANASYLASFLKQLSHVEDNSGQIWDLGKLLFQNDPFWIERARYVTGMYNAGPARVKSSVLRFISAKRALPSAFGQAFQMAKPNGQNKNGYDESEFIINKDHVFKVVGLCGYSTLNLYGAYWKNIPIDPVRWNAITTNPLPSSEPPKDI